MHREAADANGAESPCPNCGQAGSGRYCVACGRRRVTTTASLKDLVSEAVEDLTGIEGRFFRTAWLLVGRPGALTEQYRAGVGAKYVSPVRMLLVAGAFWAATRPWREEIPLHFRDVGVSYPTVTLFAVPIFAFALFVGYYERERTYSEYLTFALYFQAAQLLLAATMTWMPSSATAAATAVFPVYYLATGSRRLWGERGVWSWVRAAFAVVIYVMALLLAFGLVVMTAGRAL